MSEGQGHSIFDKAKDLKDKVTDAIRPDAEEREDESVQPTTQGGLDEMRTAEEREDESVQPTTERGLDEMRTAGDDTDPDDQGGMAL